MQDAAGTRTFGYNATFDRISETINGIYNKVLTYHYASEGVKGRYLGFSLDNAVNSTYSYDSYGRLNQISGLGGSFQYSYLTDSELLENLTRPNGVSTQWNYEAHRDLITQVANGNISTFDYVNDALGRRTSMSRSGSAFTVPDILSYGYNNRSEVILAQSNTNSAYNYHYNYDPIGNRTTATLAGVNWDYTSNNLNQYTKLVFGDTVQEPTYDDDGNMLTCMGWTQVWNGENRLSETVKGNVRLQFTYDYLGRRIEKKVFNGAELEQHIRFVYDGYLLIEELNALDENAEICKYTWQNGLKSKKNLLSVYDATDNTHYFFNYDANQNISEITNALGEIVAHYEYSPFGKIIVSEGTYADKNHFKFSCEYYDKETNLIYYNFRYYNSDLGRWLSRDPFEELGGNNLYGFVKNNPTNYVDVLGLFEDDGRVLALAIQGRYEDIGREAEARANAAMAEARNSSVGIFIQNYQDARSYGDGIGESIFYAGNLAFNPLVGLFEAYLGEVIANPCERGRLLAAWERFLRGGSSAFETAMFAYMGAQFGRPIPEAFANQRVRHYTDLQGLNGIKKDGAIKASRPADNTGVYFFTEPFPRSFEDAKRQSGAWATGHYVEFDLPPNSVFTSNKGFTPTGGKPLDLSGLNPRYH